MLVSSLISRSNSLSFLLAGAFDFSGLLGVRAALTADDLTDGVGAAGVACLSGAAEPARRIGWRKPDLLVVVGRVDGGLEGPAMVARRQLYVG